MSYDTSVYNTLSAKYPTFEEFSTFLTSAEGGSLRVVQSSDDLVIFRYTKGKSDFNIAHVPFFRSVVWSKSQNKPVSVAPIKALPGSPAAETTVRVTEFVDGTMLHAFRDASGVRIATRTNLDATGKFYSDRTFAELFEDVFEGGSKAFLESVLEVGDFISIVLQHPEHITVAPVAKPRIYVTHYGKIQEDSVYVSSLPSSWPPSLAAYAPAVYEESFECVDAQSAVGLLNQQKNVYTWQGLVFQELASSNRWRLRNPAYVAVRNLQGSEANPMARFLRLRQKKQIKRYLSFFQNESNTLWEYEQTLRERTNELYVAYTQMNKLKTKTMKDFPYSLRPHVYALHGLYLASLPNPTPILKESVVKYVNGLSVEEQLKVLQGDRAASPSPVEAAAILVNLAAPARQEETQDSN